MTYLYKQKENMPFAITFQAFHHFHDYLVSIMPDRKERLKQKSVLTETRQITL